MKRYPPIDLFGQQRLVSLLQSARNQPFHQLDRLATNRHHRRHCMFLSTTETTLGLRANDAGPSPPGLANRRCLVQHLLHLCFDRLLQLQRDPPRHCPVLTNQSYFVPRAACQVPCQRSWGRILLLRKPPKLTRRLPPCEYLSDLHLWNWSWRY